MVLLGCFLFIFMICHSMEIDSQESSHNENENRMGKNLVYQDYMDGYAVCMKLLLNGEKCNGNTLRKNFGRVKNHSTAKKIVNKLMLFAQTGNPDDLIYTRSRKSVYKYERFKPENHKTTLDWLENLPPEKSMEWAAGQIGCSLGHLQRFCSIYGSWRYSIHRK